MLLQHVHTVEGIPFGARRRGHSVRGTPSRAFRSGHTVEGIPFGARRRGHSVRGTPSRAFRSGHAVGAFRWGTLSRAFRSGHAVEGIPFGARRRGHPFGARRRGHSVHSAGTPSRAFRSQCAGHAVEGIPFTVCGARRRGHSVHSVRGILSTPFVPGIPSRGIPFRAVRPALRLARACLRDCPQIILPVASGAPPPPRRPHMFSSAFAAVAALAIGLCSGHSWPPPSVWPADRVLVNGTAASPASLDLSSVGVVAAPGRARVGAATARLYDPIVFSDGRASVFLCRSNLASTCPRGTTARNVWYCPSPASALCYNSTGPPPPHGPVRQRRRRRRGAVGWRPAGRVVRRRRWSRRAVAADERGAAAGAAVPRAGPPPPSWPTGRLALWCCTARAAPPPPRRPSLAPARPWRPCRRRWRCARPHPAARARPAAAAVACGVVRHVPPRARPSLGAVRPLFHVAGHHVRGAPGPVGLILTAALTTPLFPLLSAIDACWRCRSTAAAGSAPPPPAWGRPPPKIR